MGDSLKDAVKNDDANRVKQEIAYLNDAEALNKGIRAVMKLFIAQRFVLSAAQAQMLQHFGAHRLVTSLCALCRCALVCVSLFIVYGS
jgi:hypothetical protein